MKKYDKESDAKHFHRVPNSRPLASSSERSISCPVEEKVKINQKVVKHSQPEKLYDAFITILGGAHGIVEINTRLRSDEAL